MRLATFLHKMGEGHTHTQPHTHTLLLYLFFWTGFRFDICKHFRVLSLIHLIVIVVVFCLSTVIDGFAL